MRKMERYHPGTCEATARGKRFGNNLTPQRYDNPGHIWHRAKIINWGPWSCCGRAVNSKGCQTREPRRGALTTPTPKSGVGAHVQFLINGRNRILVVGEDMNCWLLSTGRIAKKATEGTSWVWVGDASSENISQLLSSLRVGEQINQYNERFCVQDPRRSFYSFGNWGYHTNDHDSQIMPGFSSLPPGAEICGTYKVLFVAALRYDTNQQRANIFLRRQPKSGRLTIKKSSRPFAIGVDGRLGTGRASRSVTSQTIFDGEFSLSDYYQERDGLVNRYFGPGYKFYGFAANSEASSSYSSMAANASLIVTKLNDNKGRIYRVESPKAFKLVQCESGVMSDESALFDSQDEETNDARRICKCRHYSFLCRELGLPCSASALITSFVTSHQPFIFAEPGDIWIDVRLSTPNRTYVLARRISQETTYRTYGLARRISQDTASRYFGM